MTGKGACPGFVSASKSRNSGLVIDVADESKERKAPVVQYRNHEGRNQLFELEPVKE